MIYNICSFLITEYSILNEPDKSMKLSRFQNVFSVQSGSVENTYIYRFFPLDLKLKFMQNYTLFYS